MPRERNWNNGRGFRKVFNWRVCHRWVLIILLGCLLSACADASWRRTRIAFFTSLRDRGGEAGIFVINADGSKRRLISEAKGAAEKRNYPTWSPDGKTIAAAVNVRIHLFDSGGSRQVVLPVEHQDEWLLEPAWSPDGRRLAFVSMRYVGYVFVAPPHIFVINSDGSGRVQLTKDPHNWSPTWSPDGKTIAFVSRRKAGSAFRLGIYVMNADGSDQRLLAADGNHPRWSPDGQKMAYFSYGPRTGEKHLHLINADGSGEVRVLIYEGDERDAEKPPLEYPAWSPDSRALAFTSIREGNAEIFLVAGDGSGLTRLTNYVGFDGFPAWFPDGRKIAFVSDRDVRGERELYIMNADGTDIIRVGARVGSLSIGEKLESPIPFALAPK